MPATGPVATEASVIPRTIFNLAFRVYVQERTFLIVASVEPGVKITFRHFGHIIFVQEFALVAFFAQTPQPMLAHDGTVTTDVAERTSSTFVAFCAIGGVEKQTHGSGRLIHARKR